MADTVRLTIRCCEECRHCDKSRYYTADSFEHVVAWNCTHPALEGLSNPTTDHDEWNSPPGITLHEAFDEAPGIPPWCPLREDEDG
jgi:hypothetical protein